ncbi:metal ABC transporter ATP-binding protein [Corynebacterium flavescens]|nr:MULTISPECIES: metal ABC transporter ATP-binding protein [Corynebacterium]MDN6100101.1 metal ABC transporter ATP-binding protein [Corynebacterium flavescens]MDN6235958.1 metal ABC transporter ATP-binding protein [Corynebacterium flavescens]MDN6431861.1 metal ABC transporter ATP-binding protein [Corynebacterium flavescens]MDN6475813.1 metal ABC transporter ATP-binding protein [Corynebacterium flavescens]MDN6531995.1 metal ABC transporter ATP-binding protein [Corynebacterium flavescens]
MLLSFKDAAVEPLWSHLDLAVNSGEFIAVLGPNGVGKSTLLGTILGTRKLTAGSVDVNCRVGYIPQQRMFPAELPLRARDLVSLSLAHGTLRNRRPSRGKVDELLAEVGATGIADRRVGQLSGGQQQLIRQAQALANSPQLLLADEPLLSLDPARQEDTVQKLDKWRRERGTSIIFVTHSINPVLDFISNVLYIAPFGHLYGTVDEVMRSEVLSELYGSKVNVIKVDGRLIVV